MATLRILIVDDDKNFAWALKIRCEQLQVEAEVSCDSLHAVTTIQRSAPDLILMDLNMPGMDGLATCQKLANDGRWAPDSIVLLTGQKDEQTSTRCRHLGIPYLIKGADTWERLRVIIEGAKMEKSKLENVARKRPKILSIDDDPAISYALQLRLEPYGIEVLNALDGMKGYWVALKELPDLIITDYSMPDGEGNYILSRLAAHSLTRNIPVIVLTGRVQDFSIQRAMFNLGAVAFFTKPLDFDALRDELKKHIHFSSVSHGQKVKEIVQQKLVVC
jgi:CheY-like chemotaxis protein